MLWSTRLDLERAVILSRLALFLVIKRMQCTLVHFLPTAIVELRNGRVCRISLVRVAQCPYKLYLGVNILLSVYVNILGRFKNVCWISNFYSRSRLPSRLQLDIGLSQGAPHHYCWLCLLPLSGDQFATP